MAEKYNEFLASNYDNDKLNNLFNEWKSASTSKIIEEEYTNLTGDNYLTVSFDNVRPMSYLENGIYKGYELEVNHIGDIDIYNHELYHGVEYFFDGESKNIQVAVYDADT